MGTNYYHYEETRPPCEHCTPADLARALALALYGPVRLPPPLVDESKPKEEK